MSDHKDLTHTTSGRSAEFLSRAYSLKDANEAKDLYEEWAKSYDTDLRSSSYTSPLLAVVAVVENTDKDSGHLKILDAGCGTGLIGMYLNYSSLAHFTVDGIDLTPGMLEVARQKGVYKDLDVADLTKPIERVDGSYDVVTCVGTLTKGHVGPQVFNEFARVVTHGGLIVATVHEEVWEKGGYKSVVEGLAKQDLVEIVSTNEFGMVEDSGKGGRMVVLRKR